MPRFLIINPNTSKEMTLSIKETIDAFEKDNSISYDVVMPDFGSESLESFYDYNLAAFGLIRYLESCSLGKTKDNQYELDYDGVLIGCFGEPGLYALREVCNVPVVGIAEASMVLSLSLGAQFSILTASKEAVPMMWDMVRQYALVNRCSSIDAIGISVLDVERDPEQAADALIKVGKSAQERGAESLLLGCAGMTGLGKIVEHELNIPVIDPILAGYAQLKMLTSLGLKQCKSGIYAPPAPKKILRRELLA